MIEAESEKWGVSLLSREMKVEVDCSMELLSKTENERANPEDARRIITIATTKIRGKCTFRPLIWIFISPVYHTGVLYKTLITKLHVFL